MTSPVTQRLIHNDIICQTLNDFLKVFPSYYVLFLQCFDKLLVWW